MAMALSPVPTGNVTQALSTIQSNFVALQAAFNQLIAQTTPIATPQAAQGLVIPGMVTSYNGQPLAAGNVLGGNGLTTVVAYARTLGQTSAFVQSAPLLSYPVGNTDGSFLLVANVSVTAGSTFNFSVAATHYSPGFANVIFTQHLPFMVATDLVSSSVVSATGAGPFTTVITNTIGDAPYYGMPISARCSAHTTITIFTELTAGFTDVRYNIEAAILQVA